MRSDASSASTPADAPLVTTSTNRTRLCTSVSRVVFRTDTWRSLLLSTPTTRPTATRTAAAATSSGSAMANR